MITIITPEHDAKYLGELAKSIAAQTYQDFEWRILVNGDESPEAVKRIVDTDKAIITYAEEKEVGVGMLKRRLCEEALGDIIVEVDHDDLLMPNALQEVVDAFASNPDACFVYSNVAYATKVWKPYTWSEAFGWRYRPFIYEGHELKETIAPEPIAHNICYIWYAPDHLRAWRKADYMAIGGHDPELKVADDHDLMMRMYLHGRMVHIDKCLYIYRVHNGNTWLKNNQLIQTETVRLFDKYIYALAEKWTADMNLKKVDLCSGGSAPKGYLSIDMNAGADIRADLNERWPLNDNSVGIIRAHDAIEHLRDPIHTMNEAYRVLAHGGFFMILVPSTDGRGAFQDPTHVSFWNENSFWYYTRKSMNNYLGEKCPVRFQKRRLATVTIDKFHEENKIPYVWAVLVAIKGEPYHGVMEI